MAIPASPCLPGHLTSLCPSLAHDGCILLSSPRTLTPADASTQAGCPLSHSLASSLTHASGNHLVRAELCSKFTRLWTEALSPSSSLLRVGETYTDRQTDTPSTNALASASLVSAPRVCQLSRPLSTYAVSSTYTSSPLWPPHRRNLIVLPCPSSKEQSDLATHGRRRTSVVPSDPSLPLVWLSLTCSSHPAFTPANCRPRGRLV